MRIRHLTKLLLLVSSLSLFGGPAQADDLADEADLHFKIATERYTQRDYRGALEHFLVSNRLVPNRNVIFNIARTYEALQEYPDAFRYYVQALEVETDSARRPVIEESIARIRSNVAIINVTTDPPGATVYINRRDLGPRGSTPRLLGFPAGKYKVIVDLPGYEPAEVDGVDAQLGAQQNISLKLSRIVGQARIVGDMAGAAVRVDDASGPVACTAPCDLTLPPGRHRLYLSQEGYQSSEQDINVVAKETVTARYKLNPLTGSLTVIADERDAVVEIDGKPVGFTPAVLNVQSGQRKVRISMRGFRTIEQTVDIKPSQQTRLDVSLRQFEEVEAASRSSEAIEDAPASVTVISGQELRAMGYPTVAEALRGVRGMYTTYDGSYSFAGIRGLNIPGDFGNRVLSLVNGTPINDTWVNIAYLDYTARTDLEDVERIEIVRSPGSVLYGTGAFSGVINVVTKGRPTSTSASVGASVVENSVMRGRASVSIPFGRDSGMWMSVAGGRGLGRSYEFPGYGSAPDADHFNVGTLEGRLWAKSFSMQWYLNSRSKALPNGFAATAIGDDRTVFRDTRGFIEAKLEPRFSDKFATSTRVSLNLANYHDNLWFDPFPGQTTWFSTEDYNDIWVFADQRFEISPTKALRITLGGEGQVHFQGKQRGYDTICLTDGSCGEYYYTPDGAPPGSGQYDEHPYQIAAGYGLVDIIPSDKVRISAGVRVDYFSTIQKTSGPSPRLAFILKPYDGGNLKIMGARAFRAPSIYELYWSLAPFLRPPGSTYTDAAGNAVQLPTLNPEQVYSGELEYTHRFSSTVAATAAGYVSYFPDLIAQAGSYSPEDPTHYANANVPVLVFGGEAELRRDWRQGWMAAVTYSYARAQYMEEAGQDNFRRVTNSPEHMASFKGAVPLLGKALTLATRFTFEGPRFDRNSANYPGAPPQEQSDPALVWDVVLSGQTDLGNLRYNVGIYNVADWRYSAPVGSQFGPPFMPQNGRTFLASANATF